MRCMLSWTLVSKMPTIEETSLHGLMWHNHIIASNTSSYWLLALRAAIFLSIALFSSFVLFIKVDYYSRHGSWNQSTYFIDLYYSDLVLYDR